MDGADLVRWGAVAIGTVIVIVTALVIGGFAVLFRRRGRSVNRILGPAGIEQLSTRAGSLLVRVDDAVRDADQELGFAIAQFGPEQAGPFRNAISSARAKVSEAFRLRQLLDDADQDTDRQRREWTNQIIALCEQAQRTLDEHNAAFARLRAREVDAASTLAGLRARIDATERRLADARQRVANLRARYDAPAVAAIEGHPDAAAAALAEARSAADAVAPALSPSGVSAVSVTLERAGAAAHRADALLSAVDAAAAELGAAEEALALRRDALRDDLVEARAQREAAPDPDTQRAILDAMVGVEASLAADGSRNPAAALDALNGAAEQLDLALASARNQASRLTHARAAYESTLVFAQSQLAAARSVIGGASVSARTRLAEAERQLTLAQVATDPVEALDTIRRAVTHARDAEDLARYGS